MSDMHIFIKSELDYRGERIRRSVVRRRRSPSRGLWVRRPAGKGELGDR